MAHGKDEYDWCLAIGNVIMAKEDLSTVRWVEEKGIHMSNRSGIEYATGIMDYKVFEALKKKVVIAQSN